jgi:multiple sugar transport system permease protein
MQGVAVKKSARRRVKKEHLAGLFMAMTPITGFVIFGLIPMLIAVVMSTMKISGFTFDKSYFVGLNNYKAVLGDRLFREAVVNTLVISLSVPVTLVISLLVATLLNKKVIGTKFFRTVFFIPFACSAVALTTMWKWMYNSELGIINSFVYNVLGIGDSMGEPIKWTTDPHYFWQSMIIMTVWSGIGFNIILFSAALGSVPKVYYEAAKIDGASRPRQFFSITFPAISPTTFYLFTIGLIASLQEFARYRVMVGDYSPGGKEVTVVYYLYKMFSRNLLSQGMGMASAVSLILGAAIFLITIGNFMLSRFWVHYD